MQAGCWVPPGRPALLPALGAQYLRAPQGPGPPHPLPPQPAAKGSVLPAAELKSCIWILPEAGFRVFAQGAPSLWPLLCAPAPQRLPMPAQPQRAAPSQAASCRVTADLTHSPASGHRCPPPAGPAHPPGVDPRPSSPGPGPPQSPLLAPKFSCFARPLLSREPSGPPPPFPALTPCFSELCLPLSCPHPCFASPGHPGGRGGGVDTRLRCATLPSPPVAPTQFCPRSGGHGSTSPRLGGASSPLGHWPQRHACAQDPHFLSRDTPASDDGAGPTQDLGSSGLLTWAPPCGVTSPGGTGVDRMCGMVSRGEGATLFWCVCSGMGAKRPGVLCVGWKAWDSWGTPVAGKAWGPGRWVVALGFRREVTSTVLFTRPVS